MAYFRSRKLLDGAKDAPCMLCGIEDRTVVACHANGFGKGMGIKAPDYFTAYCCYACHMQIDQSKLSREEKDAMWLEAFVKTVAYWFDSGLVKVK